MHALPKRRGRQTEVELCMSVIKFLMHISKELQQSWGSSYLECYRSQVILAGFGSLKALVRIQYTLQLLPKRI
jgi:hypothetical protein